MTASGGGTAGWRCRSCAFREPWTVGIVVRLVVVAVGLGVVTHPGIVVDEERRSADHPRRVPLVLGRTLRFTDAGLSLLPGSNDRAALDVAGGGARLTTSKGVEIIAHGDKFRVRHHPYRLESGDDDLVDVRRIGSAIAFNCWHAGDGDVRWRGFALDDVERTPIDVLVTKGGVAYAQSTTGVPLAHVVATTESQRAGMEPAVAAALVRPFLAEAAWALGGARGRRITPSDVIATWQGAVVVPRAARRSAQVAELQALATTTFCRLQGRDLPDYDDTTFVGESPDEEMQKTPLADDATVAAVLRALFPDAWAVERAVTEQAAMLDVDSVA